MPSFYDCPHTKVVGTGCFDLFIQLDPDYGHSALLFFTLAYILALTHECGLFVDLTL